MTPPFVVTTRVRALEPLEDALRVLDQRRLPAHREHVLLASDTDVAQAIATLTVRGAPLIGACALYGLWLAARASHGDSDVLARVEQGARTLKASRPTAVNLFHAVDHGLAAVAALGSPGRDAVIHALRTCADTWARQDEEMCLAMGRLGAALLPDEGAVLTHCNTGALATCGIGTAAGVIRAALAAGKKLTVFADETRPLLQGARLTAWELMEDGVDVTVLPDGAAASLLASGRVAAAITGADRIAVNGDTANKVGTLGVALACDRYGVPFMVAAPWTTVDLRAQSAADIPIEHRSGAEVTHVGGVATAPAGVKVFNPSFDVTPGTLVKHLVTDRGVFVPPHRLDRVGLPSA